MPRYKVSAEERFQQDPVPSKKGRLEWASVDDDVDTCAEGSSTTTSCEEGEASAPRLTDLVRSPEEPTRLPLNLYAKSGKLRSLCEDLAILEFAIVVPSPFFSPAYKRTRMDRRSFFSRLVDGIRLRWGSNAILRPDYS